MTTPRSQRSLQARRSRPPPSREAEYKLIQDTINEICATIKKYAQKYFTKREINYEAALASFKEITETWKVDPETFTTWKEFSERVVDNNIDKVMKSKEGFKDLIHICERSKEFEVMIPQVREKTVTCMKEHVYKYCHSFVEETGGVEAGIVMDYEHQIRSYKKDIERMINAINADILRYSDVKSSLEKFISEGGNIGKLMENICVQIVEIAHEVKKWISDDAAYPDKLQQEIHFNQGYKETMQEDVFKMHQRRESMERSLERREKVKKKLEKRYNAKRKEKGKRKDSIQTLNIKIERLESQIAQKNERVLVDRLDKLEHRNTRGTLTTKNTMTSNNSSKQGSEGGRSNARLAKQMKEVDRLNDWVSVAKRQRIRLEKELKEISDRTYETKVELVTNRHESEEMQGTLEGLQMELNSMHERLDSLDRKTAVMKHIRVLKMSPETLRKLYRRRREFYQQGQLSEACRYVATEIAADWKRLYECLPFEPQRAHDKLSNDIELIDIISARNDRTIEEQALKCLEKWRTFSRRNADVAQLIRGLRKLNKEDLADNVEMRFSMESVYG